MSFSAYQKYKDSGVEWLGHIPEHWQVQRVRWLCEIKKRIVGELGYDVLSVTKQGLRIKDLESNEGQHSMDYSKYQLVEPGDFAMNHMDLITGWIDISKVTGVTSPDYRVFTIRDPSVCHSEYVLYAFKMGYANKIFYAYGQGSSQLGRWRLPTEAFQGLQFPLPPLDEQVQIAAFLDRAITEIDELIADQKHLIELLAEKREAIISQAVTKGLHSEVQMKASAIDWLGHVPAHWGVVRSRRMFAVRSEPALTTDRMLTASQKHGVLFQSEFVEREGRQVVEVILGKDSLLHVEPDDFIISMRSFQGGIEWCRLRGSTSYHYVIIRAVTEIHPAFFAYLFKSATYIQALRATTDLIRDGQELRYSNFIQVDLPSVPIQEQVAIAAYLDRETAALATLATDAASAIDLLRERRTALISAAVTGQIDVRRFPRQKAA